MPHHPIHIRSQHEVSLQSLQQPKTALSFDGVPYPSIRALAGRYCKCRSALNPRDSINGLVLSRASVGAVSSRCSPP